MRDEFKPIKVLIEGKWYVTAQEEDEIVDNCTGCEFFDHPGCDHVTFIKEENNGAYCGEGNPIIYKLFIDPIKGKRKLLIL